MSTGASSNASNSVTGRLEAIVLEHLETADFDVETFSRLSGLSRSDLYRKIKKHTGKSVTEFVRDIRLKKSLEYLKDEERTASEVAYLVGFSSATYFSKCFKDKFGFTPGEVGYHQEKIADLLAASNKQNEDSKQKHSLFKPVIIITTLIGIILIGWYFTKASNNQNPGTNQEQTETTNPDDRNGKGLSIALLPIVNETGVSENDAITYYASWVIIANLNKIDSITRIPPMRTVGKYKDSLNIPTREITQRIKVDYILQGYFKSDGSGSYNFFFELLDAEDNLIWNHVFKYQGNTPEQLYREYGQTAILAARQLGIDNPIIEDPANKTKNPLAMQYFSEGLLEANSYTKQGWNKGIALIENAIKKDPEFIDAYMELANLWLYGGMNWSYAPQQESWSKAKALYNKVLEIDPDSFDAKEALANGIFYYELNVQDTVPESFGIPYEEWMEMRPDHAEKTGKHETSLKSNLNWQNRDPVNAIVNALIALNYYFLGRSEEALDKLDENYPIHKNDLNFLREASKTYYFLGEDEKMRAAVLHFFDSFSERPPIIRWLRAIVADKNNDQEIVETQLQALKKSYDKKASGSPAWFIALYHAYKKDEDKALEWLEKSYEAREVEMTWLAQEPDLHILGDQPRYRALLDSMNFPESARRHVIFRD